jgi:hypothetical protein
VAEEENILVLYGIDVHCSPWDAMDKERRVLH